MDQKVKRVMLLALYLFTASQSFGQSCRNPTVQERTALQQLYDRDKAASVDGDWQTLGTLWTDDGVALPPGEDPVVGIDAIRSWLKYSHLESSKVRVTDYSIRIRAVSICGDTAIEWGTSSIALRPKGAPTSIRANGNIERVLQRQSDGAWKFARAIWNLGKPEAEKTGGSQ
jgi:uncharacterized protein (TIGR02246 family)